MERHLFGSTKRQVPVIGQGTWYIETAERRLAIAALRRGLDLGMTHIDTAEMYGSGAAEEVVAEAIAGRRDEVFLVSKVLPQNASRSGHGRGLRELARAAEDRPAGLLPAALARSRIRWRRRSRRFEWLQREGKIRSWGVSNFDVADLEEAVSIAGEGSIACNQVLYHLQEARDRARRDSLVRAARRRRRWLQPVRAFDLLSRPGDNRRPRTERNRRCPRRDSAPGRAPLPGPASLALYDSQGLQSRACRRKCRRG